MLIILVKLFVKIILLTCLSISVLLASEILSEEEFPLTDFSKHTVTLEEIYSAGPPRDGIKSIDDPQFISIRQAKSILDAREPVVAVNIDGVAKAYPLRILLYHEIINDELNGEAIFVTHCPLCNTAIVFSRNVAGQVLEFGTSGRVRDSNLIMYDRETESWWQQFTGDAIVGKYAGTFLQNIPSQIVPFSEFSQTYAQGLVLSQKTGFRRYYGKTPYPGYDDPNGDPFLFKGKIDPRLPPLERVLALASESRSVVFPFSYLEKHPLINTTFENTKVLVISQASMFSTVDKKILKDSKMMLTAAAFDRSVDGKELVFELKRDRLIDKQTLTEWNIFGEAIAGELKGSKLEQVDKNVHFAFAWLAFYDNAEIVAE